MGAGKKETASQPQTPAQLERESGNKCYKAKNFQGAIKHYNSALKLLNANPIRGDELQGDYVKTLTNRANCYFHVSKFQACVDDCTTALSTDPSWTKARYWRAYAWEQLGDYATAKADVELCLKDAKDAKARSEYSKLLSKIRKGMAAAKVKLVANEEGVASTRGQASKGTPTSHDLHAHRGNNAAVAEAPSSPQSLWSPCSGRNIFRVRFTPTTSSESGTTTSPSSSSSSSPIPSYHPAIQGSAFKPISPLPSSHSNTSSASSSSSSSTNGTTSTSENPAAEGDEAAIAPPTSGTRHLCSRGKKGYDIKRLLDQAGAARVEGEMWALVEQGWWDDWWEYVGQGEAMEVDGDDDQEDQAFRPVNNKKLVFVRRGKHHESRGGPYTLKPGLVEGRDFKAVSMDAWRALISWYGGGPGLFRELVSAGPEEEEDQEEEGGAGGAERKEGLEKGHNRLVLDLYPPETNWTPQEYAEHKSSYSPIERGVLEPCVACHSPARAQCARCHKAWYCCRGCQASHWKYHRSQCKDDKKPPVDLSVRGQAGLHNLGNTCFMASALQCLSHTHPLTLHFLTNRYKDDLNEQNALGTGGRVAREYDQLIKELWFGTSSAVNPSGLKKAISKAEPMFLGNSQHDSQEFLNSLLDKLHEDLNRVKKKPYFTIKDDDDRPESVVAHEAWRNYLKRDNSVVVDNLAGQFKSKLVCPECKKVSVVFDAFMTVPLELPDVNLRVLKILFFPDVSNNSRKAKKRPLKPRRLKINMSCRATIWDLRQEIASMTGADRDNLCVIHLYKRKLYDTVRDSLPIARLVQDEEETFILAAYEVPRYPNQMYAMVMHRKRRRLDGSTQEGSATDDAEDKADDEEEEEEEGGDSVAAGNHELIGFPFLLSYEAQWTCKDMRERLWAHVHPLLQLRSGEEADGQLLRELKGGFKVRQVDSVGKDLSSSQREQGETGDEDKGSASDAEDGAAAGEDEASEGEANPNQMAVSKSTTPAATVEGPVLPDDPDQPVKDFFRPNAASSSSLVYLSVDWEGPLEGRYGLPDDIMTAKRKGKRKEGMMEVEGEGEMEDGDEEDEEDAPNDWLTLDQCLKKFSSPERLDRDNPWYCNRCKDHMQAVKTLQIWRLPRVLVIMLKRFQSSRERKLDTLVDFPIDGLDLAPHVHGPHVADYLHLYDLFAVSNHYGTRSWGHYTAYARRWDGPNLDSQWYCFDDSRCEPVEESRVVSKDAYILFYRRREGEDGLEWPIAMEEDDDEEEADQDQGAGDGNRSVDVEAE